MVKIIRTFRPHTVITFGDDGAYGHPNHIAVSRAMTKALSLVAAEFYVSVLGQNSKVKDMNAPVMLKMKKIIIENLKQAAEGE